MATRKQQREQATKLLAAHLLKTGLSQTSLRQLATAAGVSDRMLLYYFDDKADALTSGLGMIAEEFTVRLEHAVSQTTKLSPAQIIDVTTKLLDEPDTKPFFRLWTEAVAAAARQEPLYRKIASLIAEGFLTWTEARIEGGTPKTRRATAAMILAMIDGMALLEIATDEKRAKMAGDQMRRLIHPDFE